MLLATPPMNINSNTYDQKTNGHRLCGLTGLSFTVSPTSYPKKPVGFKISIDLDNYQFNLEIDPK